MSFFSTLKKWLGSNETHVHVHLHVDGNLNIEDTRQGRSSDRHQKDIITNGSTVLQTKGTGMDVLPEPSLFSGSKKPVVSFGEDEDI